MSQRIICLSVFLVSLFLSCRNSIPVNDYSYHRVWHVSTYNPSLKREDSSQSRRFVAYAEKVDNIVLSNSISKYDISNSVVVERKSQYSISDRGKGKIKKLIITSHNSSASKIEGMNVSESSCQNVKQNSVSVSKKYAIQVLFFLATALGLGVTGIRTFFRRKLYQISKWAKRNIIKGQVLIVFTQLALLALGLSSGYNLKKAGIDFSSISSYILLSIVVLGFFFAPFLRPKESSFKHPIQLNRNILVYLAIIISTYLFSVIGGNKFIDKNSSNPISKVFISMDQKLYSDPKTYLNDPSTATISNQEFNKRMQDEGMRCALGIFLIILLLGTLCAGICLTFFSLASGGILLPYFLLGILVTVGSIWGIVKCAKMCRKQVK